MDRYEGIMYNKRKIGSKQEAIATKYLESLGYSIIENNFYCRSGEIDIIAKEGDYYVFIEVKYRSSTEHGYPIEAIDQRKIRKVVNTTKYYMLTHNISEYSPCRFDVIVILGEDITLIKNAFDGY